MEYPFKVDIFPTSFSVLPLLSTKSLLPHLPSASSFCSLSPITFPTFDLSFFSSCQCVCHVLALFLPYDKMASKYGAVRRYSMHVQRQWKCNSLFRFFDYIRFENNKPSEKANEVNNLRGNFQLSFAVRTHYTL